MSRLRSLLLDLESRGEILQTQHGSPKLWLHCTAWARERGRSLVDAAGAGGKDSADNPAHAQLVVVAGDEDVSVLAMNFGNQTTRIWIGHATELETQIVRATSGSLHQNEIGKARENESETGTGHARQNARGDAPVIPVVDCGTSAP